MKNLEIEINTSLQINTENGGMINSTVFSPEIVVLLGSESIENPTENTDDLVERVREIG